MKKQYSIFFEGILEKGYVKLVLPCILFKDVKFENHDEAKKFATKYRFKWVANLMCRICNWSSKVNYDFRTFKVVEV